MVGSDLPHARTLPLPAASVQCSPSSSRTALQGAGVSGRCPESPSNAAGRSWCKLPRPQDGRPEGPSPIQGPCQPAGRLPRPGLPASRRPGPGQPMRPDTGKPAGTREQSRNRPESRVLSGPQGGTHQQRRNGSVLWSVGSRWLPLQPTSMVNQSPARQPAGRQAGMLPVQELSTAEQPDSPRPVSPWPSTVQGRTWTLQ